MLCVWTSLAELKSVHFDKMRKPNHRRISRLLSRALIFKTDKIIYEMALTARLESINNTRIKTDMYYYD